MNNSIDWMEFEIMIGDMCEKICCNNKITSIDDVEKISDCIHRHVETGVLDFIESVADDIGWDIYDYHPMC